MALTTTEIATAKKIVEGLVWQPAEGHNYRYSKAVNTLTRFCEAASMEPDVARLVIEYLKNEVIEETDGISLLNKKMEFGAGWKAMDAWYQTAAGEKFAGTESTKVRVFQVLMQPPADGDAGDGPYLVEDGCQYKVSHTFYWNVEELPELDESSSGIQYTMQGITRDSTTGLYSCVIEVRERVQQDVPLYDSAKTIYEKIQKEAHIGVKAKDLQTTGQAASVNKGVIVERQISKNPDCTSNVENTVRTEKFVAGALKQYRKTLRGTVETTTDRNAAAALTDGTEEGGTPMKVGETRRSEKTPGGLYNNTTESVTAEPAGKIQSSCEMSGDVEHTDVTVVNVLKEPEEEHQKGKQNEVVKKTVRKNDQGTFDVETVTKQYSPTVTVATTNWGTEKAVTTTTRHDTEMKPEASLGDASASPDDASAATTSVTEYTPIKVDSEWITWESTTVTSRGTYKYAHGARIFKNVTKDDLSKMNSGLAGSNVGIDVNINRFGLYDGKIAYTNLVSWTESDSGGGGVYGGHQDGTITFTQYKTDAIGRSYKRTISVGVTHYYGRGNEGSEAAVVANQTYLAGLHLPSRTYVNGAVTVGNWTADND